MFGRQVGAGMIEVLVALLIVAFALLGMAGLQISSLRYQRTAQVRGLAALYEGEIADRIRANMTGAHDGSYVTNSGEKFTSTPGTAPVSCEAAKCSASDVAKSDVYNWRVNLSRSMGGWGEIIQTDTAVSLATSPQYTALIYFREPNKRDYDDTQDANCRSGALSGVDDPNSIRCFRIVVTP